MAEVLTLTVSDYLRRLTASVWRWGECDCVFFAINWVRDSTGRDPGEKFRGTYSDEAGALALADREGGFAETVCRAMTAAGFEQTALPRDGDVGIVCAPMPPDGETTDLVMAIRFGGRWIVRAPKGLRGRSDFETFRAWRIS